MAPPQPWLRLTPTLPFSLDDAAAWISQHGHPQIPPASVPLALELDLLRHEVVRRLRVLREPRSRRSRIHATEIHRGLRASSVSSSTRFCLPSYSVASALLVTGSLARP
jgi:hypothetical protein